MADSGHQRAHRAGQQPPDPAAVFRRRSPVPQVQHDHADARPGGERVEQPGGDRLHRAGGGQEQRAGDGRFPGLGNVAPGRRGAGNQQQHRQQRGHGGRRPRAPTARPRAAAHPSGTARSARSRRRGRRRPPTPGPARPPRRTTSRAPAAGRHRRGTHPAGTSYRGEQPDRNALARPAEHPDQPDHVEGPRPHQHPAGAGRVAGGQLDRDGRGQRAAADDREHHADSTHSPSLTWLAAAGKEGNRTGGAVNLTPPLRSARCRARTPRIYVRSVGLPRCKEGDT